MQPQLYCPDDVDKFLTFDRPITPDGEICEEPGRLRQSMSISFETAAARLKCIMHSQPDDKDLEAIPASDPILSASPLRPSLIHKVAMWSKYVHGAIDGEDFSPPVLETDLRDE